MCSAETGRIVEPFGDAQCLFGEMPGFCQFSSPKMVEIQAAECCESPCVIPELLTELPGPRIGSANVGSLCQTDRLLRRSRTVSRWPFRL